LDVTPYVISAPGAIGVTVELISVDFYINLETSLTAADESEIEPPSQRWILRFRLYSPGLERVRQILLPGGFVGIPA
jgi:hypothetical protein